jgi:trigger factor
MTPPLTLTFTKRSESSAEFTVSVPTARLELIRSHVFDELRPRAKAPGFRPGKAPDNLVERTLGSSLVQSEVIDHALQQTYAEAVTQEKLAVVAPPQVSIAKFVPYTTLEYQVQVELLAPPKLADYKKFKIKKPESVVPEGKAETVLQDLRRRQATRLEVKRPAKLGDEVVFDFAGIKDGQPVPGASAKKQTLALGSGNFIPGFEDELVGLALEAEKTFDITFPKDYHEQSLAGQVVTFTVTLHTITELVLPEVDDAFAATVGPFKTAAELKADIADRLASDAAETAARDFETAVLDELIAKSTYHAPEALVRQQLDSLKAEMDRNLAYSGLDLERYLEMTKQSAEEFEKGLRPQAERRVALALLMTAVADQEKIEVSAEEVAAEVARLKSQYLTHFEKSS